MSGLPLFLLAPVLIALFLWRRRPTVRSSMILWSIGLLLQRVVPLFMPGARRLDLTAPLPVPPLEVEIIVWVGSALLAAGLVGLATFDRPRRRREVVWAALLGVYLLVGSSSPSAIPAAAILAIPALWSFRWRARLGALQLILANLAGFLSLLLLVINFDFGIDPNNVKLTGFARFDVAVQVLGLLYALLSIPATASRVHLSIRSIGRRLVGSHLLAALIPFVLAGLFLMLSGTLYLANYRGVLGSRYLSDVSGEAKKRIAEDFSQGLAPERLPFGGEAAGQILLVREGNGPVGQWGGEPIFDPSELMAEVRPSGETPLLWDGATLFVRARLDTVRDGMPVHIEALAPADSIRMSTISRIAGVSIRIHPSISVTRTGGGVQLGGIGSDSAGASIGPSRIRSGDLPGGAIIGCLHLEEGVWTPTAILVSSSASFGETLLALIPSARDNPLGTVVLVVLVVIAFLFLTAIWITVGMVYSMGSSITQSVRALTQATAAVGAGRLDHRIDIGGNDDLWRVAESFNRMTDGLKNVRAMEREAQRREEELRLAREIQDRLLPASPPLMDRVELAGLSLPAREIGGDYFDYIPLEGGLIGLAVADVSGKGTPAALLMSTFRASLRSQDLASLGPGEVLGRLNRFIHSSVDPGKFITAFIGLLDPAAGTIRYANAGHDPPILIGADGAVRELTGGGLILGMLPQIAYEEATAELPMRSVLAVYTDGVTEARNEAGEFYGTERLVEVMRECYGEPCVALLQKIVLSIQKYAGEAPQSDDITIILARRR